MKNIRFKSSWALLIFSVLFISSCSKREDVNYGSAPDKQQSQERKIKEMIKKLPLTKFMDAANAHRNAAHGKNTTLMGGWDFSNPGGNGNSYTSPSGFTFSSSANTVFLSPNAFGGNAPSVGTVVAGPSSLDINGTFCLSADIQECQV